MNKYDVLKLKAVTLYLLDKCGELDYIHLFKMLYFAERRMYATYGISLIKDTFCALPKGPVPSFLYDTVKKVAESNYFEHENIDLLASALKHGEGEYKTITVMAKEQPELDELSKIDIEMLDWVIEKYLNKTSLELSEESHDKAWQKAFKVKNAHVMDGISIAEAGGASVGMLAYVEENEALNAIWAD